MLVVCFCRPSKTLIANEFLNLEGVESYCPTVNAKRRVPRRNRQELRDQPLISGLLFVALQSMTDAEDLAKKDPSLGLRKMMAFGRPAVITRTQLTELFETAQQASDSFVDAEKAPKFYVGDRVTIKGPLQTIEFLVCTINKNNNRAALESFVGNIKCDADFSALLLLKNQA